MYIIPSLYRATLHFYHAIVSTLSYLKWHFIQSLVFKSSIIIDNDLVSNFIFMVYCFTIFVCVTFIDLCLLLMM